MLLWRKNFAFCVSDCFNLTSVAEKYQSQRNSDVLQSTFTAKISRFYLEFQVVTLSAELCLFICMQHVGKEISKILTGRVSEEKFPSSFSFPISLCQLSCILKWRSYTHKKKVTLRHKITEVQAIKCFGVASWFNMRICFEILWHLLS